jgi:hypothetical protein
MEKQFLFSIRTFSRPEMTILIPFHSLLSRKNLEGGFGWVWMRLSIIKSAALRLYYFRVWGLGMLQNVLFVFNSKLLYRIQYTFTIYVDTDVHGLCRLGKWTVMGIFLGYSCGQVIREWVVTITVNRKWRDKLNFNIEAEVAFVYCDLWLELILKTGTNLWKLYSSKVQYF